MLALGGSLGPIGAIAVGALAVGITPNVGIGTGGIPPPGREVTPNVGAAEPTAVGAGLVIGNTGVLEGMPLGTYVGIIDAIGVTGGIFDGDATGVTEGIPVADGIVDGITEGIPVADGIVDGITEGIPVADGIVDGIFDGDATGVTEGILVADGVIDGVGLGLLVGNGTGNGTG